MKRKLLLGITILSASHAFTAYGMNPQDPQFYTYSSGYQTNTTTYPLQTSHPTYAYTQQPVPNVPPLPPYQSQQHTPPPYFPHYHPTPREFDPYYGRHVSPPVTPYPHYSSFQQTQLPSSDQLHPYYQNPISAATSTVSLPSAPTLIYSSNPLSQQPTSQSFVPASIRQSQTSVSTNSHVPFLLTGTSATSSEIAALPEKSSSQTSGEPAATSTVSHPSVPALIYSSNPSSQRPTPKPFIPASIRQSQTSVSTNSHVPFSLTGTSGTSSEIAALPEKSSSQTSVEGELYPKSSTSEEMSSVPKLGLSFGMLSPSNERLPFLSLSPIQSTNASPKLSSFSSPRDTKTPTIPSFSSSPRDTKTLTIPSLYPPIDLPFLAPSSPVQSTNASPKSSPFSFLRDTKTPTIPQLPSSTATESESSKNIFTFPDPLPFDNSETTTQNHTILTNPSHPKKRSRHRRHLRRTLSSSTVTSTSQTLPLKISTEELKEEHTVNSSIILEETSQPTSHATEKPVSVSHSHHHSHTSRKKKTSPPPVLTGTSSTPSTAHISGSDKAVQHKKPSKLRRQLQEKEEQIARLQMYTEEIEQKHRIEIERLKQNQKSDVDSKQYNIERLQKLRAEEYKKLQKQSLELQKAKQDVQKTFAENEQLVLESQKVIAENEHLALEIQETLAENERLKGKLSGKQETALKTEPTSKIEKIRQELEKRKQESEKTKQELSQEQRDHTLTKNELKRSQTTVQELKKQNQKDQEALQNLEQKFRTQTQEFNALKANQQKEKQKQHDIEAVRHENKKLHQENEELKKQISDASSKTQLEPDQPVDFEDIRRMLDSDSPAPSSALSTEPKPTTNSSLPIDQHAENKKLREEINKLKRENQTQQAAIQKLEESKKQSQAAIQKRDQQILDTLKMRSETQKKNAELENQLSSMAHQVMEFMNRQSDQLSSSREEQPTPPPPADTQHPIQHDKKPENTPAFIAPNQYEAYGKWFFNVVGVAQDTGLPQRLPVTFPPEHPKYGNQNRIYSIMPQDYLDYLWNTITFQGSQIKDLEKKLASSMTTSMKTLPGSKITFHISSDETSGDTKISVSSSSNALPPPPPSSQSSSLFPSSTGAFSAGGTPDPIHNSVQPTGLTPSLDAADSTPDSHSFPPIDDGGDLEFKKAEKDKE